MEEALKIELEKVLGRLSKQENFEFLLRSYNTTSANYSIYQGVEITIMKNRKNYYMKFPIIDNGKHVFECREDEYLLCKKEDLHTTYTCDDLGIIFSKEIPKTPFLTQIPKKTHKMLKRIEEHHEYTSHLSREINNSPEIDKLKIGNFTTEDSIYSMQMVKFSDN